MLTFGVTQSPDSIVVEALGIEPTTQCYEIERPPFADRQPAAWFDAFPSAASCAHSRSPTPAPPLAVRH